jgi:hypothetical protein
MTTSSAASDEDKAMELIGMIIGAQPHWKFIEKSLIAALKQERESLPESVFVGIENARQSLLHKLRLGFGVDSDIEAINELVADIRKWQRGTAIEGDE